MDKVERLKGYAPDQTGDKQTDGIGKKNNEGGDDNAGQAVLQGMAGIEQNGKGEDDNVVKGGALADDAHGKAVDGEDVGSAGHGEAQQAPQCCCEGYGEVTTKDGKDLGLLSYQPCRECCGDDEHRCKAQPRTGGVWAIYEISSNHSQRLRLQ